MKVLNFRFLVGIIVALLFLQDYVTAQSTSPTAYVQVRNELITSKERQELLVADNSYKYSGFPTRSEENTVLKENDESTPNFKVKYKSLVSRAYFKIIADAEKADARITREYNLLLKKSRIQEVSQKMVNEVTKKYEAHKAMLTGLKSWKIFSEDRSGDLDYFKAENEEKVQKMLNKGEADGTIVNYLIYQLADLYHVE